MTLNAFRRPALLFALLPMMCACGKHAPDPDTARQAEAGHREAEATQSAIAALPPECTLGAPGLGPRGAWLTAPKVADEPDHPIVLVYSFGKATTTRALHVALNRQALQTLEKVETRDIQGKWSDAGPVGHPAAPAACDYVWLEQELKEPRQVEALRLSFHPVEEKIVTANAGVLQDPAGQPKG